MTNHEYLKSLSVEEMSQWLNSFDSYEEAPWTLWFNKTYCQECDSEDHPISHHECAFCEINDNCRFFDYYPSPEDTIKLWLNTPTT